MKQILIVGMGGFLGSVSRFAVGGWVQRLAPAVAFPVGTLLVNIVGCFLIGLTTGFIEFRQLFGPNARLFLLIGVLGGFTTFSSFAHETTSLARDGDMLRALANIGLQVVLGLAASGLGYGLALS